MSIRFRCMLMLLKKTGKGDGINDILYWGISYQRYLSSALACCCCNQVLHVLRQDLWTFKYRYVNRISTRISLRSVGRKTRLSINMFQKYRLVSRTSFNYFYVIQICCDLYGSCGGSVCLNLVHVAPYQNAEPGIITTGALCMKYVCMYTGMYVFIYVCAYV
jgi:hypothetical protein